MQQPYQILSIGGSIIIPKTGFNISFLKKFRAVVGEEIRRGKRFIFVIGGGATCRAYQEALSEVIDVDNHSLDWLGIHTTVFNAAFVRLLFAEFAHEEIIRYPLKRIHTKKPLIVAAGWKPGSSTDLRAVQLAKTYGATEVINASNIDYVYDKNPSMHKDAKPIRAISWHDFQETISGYTWSPGANTPFDPIASAYAKKHGIAVSIVNGTHLPELKKAIRGEKFCGTRIS